MQDYVPHRDLELAGWATRLANATSADPGRYGLTAAQAEAYAEVQRAYVEALTTAMQPETRTKPAVRRKDEAKAKLVTLSRKTVGTVQSFTGTTDGMRVELGITIRKKRRRAAGSTPLRPWVRVVDTVGGRITFEVRSSEDGQRKRPAEARGYTWFYAVGETCPKTLAEWNFGGNALEPKSQLSLPADTLPGARVWLAANWFNRRMQPGSISTPAQTRVGWPLFGEGPVMVSDRLGVAA